MRADVIAPINFGRSPSPIYVETVNPEARFLAAAERREQRVRVVRAGESLELAGV